MCRHWSRGLAYFLLGKVVHKARRSTLTYGLGSTPRLRLHHVPSHSIQVLVILAARGQDSDAYGSFPGWTCLLHCNFCVRWISSQRSLFTDLTYRMNLLNVVLFTTMPPTLQAINLPATAMLGIVMSSRLILNIRNPQPQATGILTSAVKTTQFNTGFPAGYSSDVTTTMASYQVHDLTVPDLERGADSTEKTVAMKKEAS